MALWTWEDCDVMICLCTSIPKSKVVRGTRGSTSGVTDMGWVSLCDSSFVGGGSGDSGSTGRNQPTPGSEASPVILSRQRKSIKARKMRLRPALSLVAGLVVVQAACRPDVRLAATPAELAGTYALVAVDEQALPLQFRSPDGSASSLAGGRLQLRQDGSGTLTTQVHLRTPGQQESLGREFPDSYIYAWRISGSCWPAGRRGCTGTCQCTLARRA